MCFHELMCQTVSTGAVTYRVVQVTPNEDGQPQLVAGLPPNQVSLFQFPAVRMYDCQYEMMCMCMLIMSDTVCISALKVPLISRKV